MMFPACSPVYPGQGPGWCVCVCVFLLYDHVDTVMHDHGTLLLLFETGHFIGLDLHQTG